MTPSQAGKKTTTSQFRMENAFEWIPIDDTYSVYRHHTIVHCDRPQDQALLDLLLDANKTHEQGFCKTEDAIAFAAGTTSTIKNNPMMVYLEPHVLEKMRTQTFMEVLTEYDKKKVATHAKNPFDVWKKGDQRVEDVVTVDMSTHTIVHREGYMISTAILCNHSSGNYHNGHYDLERLVAYLSKDPRVQFHNPRPRRPASPDHIYSVDYDSSYSKYVSFNLYLDQMLYQQVIDYTKKYFSRKNNFISIDEIQRAIFELDALGLRAQGIALHESYYPGYDDSVSP